ncbi:Innexin inx3 [Halotydeus destructor]|nr:Innexin inx3 [Halotydeus destructor]
MDLLRISAFKSFNSSKPHICNLAFELQTKLVPFSLTVLASICCMRQLTGDTIVCSTSEIKLPALMVNLFCWIHATSSSATAWNKSVGQEIPYPGIDRSDDDALVFHTYYQWTPLFLYFSALLLYCPRGYWKACERNIVKLALEDLTSPETTKNLAYATFWNRIRSSEGRAFGLIRAKLLHLVALFVTAVIAESIVSFTFLTYGWKHLIYHMGIGSIDLDPMIKYFPRLAKCRVFHFGPSGDVVKHDLMCVLPLNNMFDKVYLYCWFCLGASLISSIGDILCDVLHLRSQYFGFTHTTSLDETFLLPIIMRNLPAEAKKELLSYIVVTPCMETEI